MSPATTKEVLKMTINPHFVSPCGLYCGVCAIHIAGRDNNQKFKVFRGVVTCNRCKAKLDLGE
jgi:hypothetical protein